MKKKKTKKKVKAKEIKKKQKKIIKNKFFTKSKSLTKVNEEKVKIVKVKKQPSEPKKYNIGNYVVYMSLIHI